MPPRGFNDVPYTPKGKPNFPRNRRQPRSLSNLKPGNHLKRRLLAVLDLRAAQAEVGCPSWAGASTSAAGLRDAPQSRHKTHSQFLPWGLLVSCLDGTAHSRGVLTAQKSPKGTRKTPQTSNDNDKDQSTSHYSAETSYKSPAPSLQDDLSPARSCHGSCSGGGGCNQQPPWSSGWKQSALTREQRGRPCKPGCVPPSQALTASILGTSPPSKQRWANALPPSTLLSKANPFPCTQRNTVPRFTKDLCLYLLLNSPQIINQRGHGGLVPTAQLQTPWWGCWAVNSL